MKLVLMYNVFEFIRLGLVASEQGTTRDVTCAPGWYIFEVGFTGVYTRRPKIITVMVYIYLM